MDHIRHLSSVMFDAELHRGHARPEVEVVESVVVVTLLQEGRVARLREIRLVVEEMQNADRLLGDQADYRLIILHANVTMSTALLSIPTRG